jgi:hypothetical protein
MRGPPRGPRLRCCSFLSLSGFILLPCAMCEAGRGCAFKSAKGCPRPEPLRGQVHDVHWAPACRSLDDNSASLFTPPPSCAAPTPSAPRRPSSASAPPAGAKARNRKEEWSGTRRAIFEHQHLLHTGTHSRAGQRRSAASAASEPQRSSAEHEAQTLGSAQPTCRAAMPLAERISQGLVR